MDVPQMLEIPNVGFIVNHNDLGPVALGFIRKCEGGFGMIDSMITNPTAPAAIRDAALDKLVSRLVASAKRRKLYKIFAFSEDEHTLERAKRHGFNVVSQTMIALTVS